MFLTNYSCPCPQLRISFSFQSTQTLIPKLNLERFSWKQQTSKYSIYCVIAPSPQHGTSQALSVKLSHHILHPCPAPHNHMKAADLLCVLQAAHASDRVTEWHHPYLHNICNYSYEVSLSRQPAGKQGLQDMQILLLLQNSSVWVCPSSNMLAFFLCFLYSFQYMQLYRYSSTDPLYALRVLLD